MQVLCICNALMSSVLCTFLRILFCPESRTSEPSAFSDNFSLAHPQPLPRRHLHVRLPISSLIL